MRYSSKVKAVINAGSSGPPSVSCQNPWLRICFSLTQEGPLLNWNLGGGVEESVRGGGSQQLRKARQSEKLPPGSTPWSGCGPKAQSTGQRTLALPFCCDPSAMSPMSQGLSCPSCRMGDPELKHPRAPFQLQYLIMTSLYRQGTGSQVGHCLT